MRPLSSCGLDFVLETFSQIVGHIFVGGYVGFALEDGHLEVLVFGVLGFIFKHVEALGVVALHDVDVFLVEVFAGELGKFGKVVLRVLVGADGRVESPLLRVGLHALGHLGVLVNHGLGEELDGGVGAFFEREFAESDLVHVGLRCVGEELLVIVVCRVGAEGNCGHRGNKSGAAGDSFECVHWSLPKVFVLRSGELEMGVRK